MGTATLSIRRILTAVLLTVAGIAIAAFMVYAGSAIAFIP